jgi:hypothetical protein
MTPTHPVVVYRLADVPAVLRAGIPPGSPLFRCCFYSAICWPTIKAGISQAFQRVPEPACDDANVGMDVARAVGHTLRETTVGLVVFATRSDEEATTFKFGFHAGDAALFRRALEEAGLTLVEGAEVFRERLRFFVSDAPVVVRKHQGRTLDFRRAAVVSQVAAPSGLTLFAIMVPPLDWSCTLIGRNGGRIDLHDVPQDGSPLRLEPPVSASDTASEPPPAADLAGLSPRRAAAVLTAATAADAEESLLRAMLVRAAELSPERLRAAASLWVRHLLSNRVTGRVGLFGDALLAGLSPLVGESYLAEIVAEEGQSHDDAARSQ